MKILIESLVLTSLVAVCLGNRFRDGLECPNYRVAEEHKDYQLRVYPELTWARVKTTTGTNYYLSKFASHFKLIKYFYYKNKSGIRIPFAYPTRFLRKNPSNMIGTQEEMAFLVPSSMAEVLPDPDDPQVEIVREPEKKYFVRTFSGSLLSNSWENEAHTLINAIKHNSRAQVGMRYECTFDPFWRVTGRLNEIWIEHR